MSDYIDREAAIEAVYCRIKQIGWEQNALALSMRQAIRDVPAADVRPVVRGKWIENYETYDSNPEWGEVQYGYICSLCGRWEYEREPFCNCGAWMGNLQSTDRNANNSEVIANNGEEQT